MSTLAEALAPRSDQLNADDLIPGPRVLKITGARISKDGRETKIVLNFEGDNGKPWKPCKTMGRAMVMAWAISDEKQFVGKMVRVYRDPEVRFGDQGAVGGIRISHMSHIDKPVNVKLTVSQGKKGLFTFHPLVTDAGGSGSEGRVDPRKKAEDWAEAHIEALKAAFDNEELEALRAKGKPALAKLQKQHPDLYARVIETDPHSAQPAPADPGDAADGSNNPAEQAGE